ncbi:MAG: hypothetical protein JJT94_04305 [Bernardetiaceae bacterium]|nr:hypothetical protein [Bernardetiaceae bacterium]
MTPTLTTIYTDAYVTVKINAQARWFYWEWTARDAEFDDKEFLDYCKMLIEISKTHDCCYFIENALHSQFVITVELQERCAMEVLYPVRNLIQKIAIVSSNNPLVKLSNKQWYDELKDKPYQEQYFDTVESAIHWISKR